MANVKYRVKEFTPTANQSGSHSVYAEAVVDNVIDNKALAKKIEARGISRAAEIKSILEEAANIILEECGENNRVQLESGEGVLISIYPRCKGSVSDADVQAHPEPYDGATVGQWELYDIPADFSGEEALDILILYMEQQGLERLRAATEIMITPLGYNFRIVRNIVTNFHQPKSTLLLLVSAYLGEDWHKIYDYALSHDFRFLSYGDSSLLMR